MSDPVLQRLERKMDALAVRLSDVQFQLSELQQLLSDIQAGVINATIPG
jgi:hypothetical protein